MILCRFFSSLVLSICDQVILTLSDPYCAQSHLTPKVWPWHDSVRLRRSIHLCDRPCPAIQFYATWTSNTAVPFEFWNGTKGITLVYGSGALTFGQRRVFICIWQNLEELAFAVSAFICLIRVQITTKNIEWFTYFKFIILHKKGESPAKS